MGTLAGLLVPPPPPPWTVDPETLLEPFQTAYEAYGPMVDHYPGPRRPIVAVVQDLEVLDDFEDAPPGQRRQYLPSTPPWPPQEVLLEELEPAPPGQRREYMPKPPPPRVVTMVEFD